MARLRLNQKLTLASASAVKRAVWEGFTQDEIATHFGVSQTTIWRIIHGRQWYEAAWPNGSVGSLPITRIEGLRKGTYIRSRELAHSKHSLEDYHERNRHGSSDPGDLGAANPSGMAGSGQHRNETSGSDTEGAEPAQPDDSIREPSRAGDSSGEDVTGPSDPSDPATRFAEREERARALDALASDAEAQLQAELEAQVKAEGPARTPTPRKTEGPDDHDLPGYDLISWAEIEERDGLLVPIVQACRGDEELDYCLRAALKMLPRSAWAERKALELMKQVAASRKIDLKKKLAGGEDD